MLLSHGESIVLYEVPECRKCSRAWGQWLEDRYKKSTCPDFCDNLLFLFVQHNNDYIIFEPRFLQPVSVVWCSKINFVLVIKVRIVRSRKHSQLSSWFINANTNPFRGKRQVMFSTDIQGNLIRPTRCCAAEFTEEGRSNKPKNARNKILESG